MIYTESELINIIKSFQFDAIVVEGYDGVGKGKVLTEIADILGVTPYRPDYNFWNTFNLSQPDRWKISGFFWDVFRQFREEGLLIPKAPLLFDRGIISGSLYNGDDRIAEKYRSLLGNSEVLHILVVCDAYSYSKFSKMRNPDIQEEEILKGYERALQFTEEYIRLFELADVNYVTFYNEFDEGFFSKYADRCKTCGHYSYGVCRHPSKNHRVLPSQTRCEYSTDKEVQDRDDTAMHGV